MTTYVRNFDCHGYAMQTEVDLSAQRKRLVRLDADGTRHPGEWQRLPASAKVTADKMLNAGFRRA